jgi:hypothetical protein
MFYLRQTGMANMNLSNNMSHLLVIQGDSVEVVVAQIDLPLKDGSSTVARVRFINDSTNTTDTDTSDSGELERIGNG